MRFCHSGLPGGARVTQRGTRCKTRLSWRGPGQLVPRWRPFCLLGPAPELGAFAELKLEEIKNGRLALVSRSGLVVWAPVTCQGPIENWAQHIADMFSAYAWCVITYSFTPPDRWVMMSVKSIVASRLALSGCGRSPPIVLMNVTLYLRCPRMLLSCAVLLHNMQQTMLKEFSGGKP